MHVNEPGNLDALGVEGLAAWKELVTCTVESAAANVGGNPYLLSAPSERTTEITGPTWNAFPARVGHCLGRQPACQVLDWRNASGDEGRRRLQEEYLEWRTVRDRDGRVRRVELTTELPDYWRVLAAYRPKEALRLVAEFARLESVPGEDVYGFGSPLAAKVTPEERNAGFVRTMLAVDDQNPLNDGRAGICCMVHKSNDLTSLVELAAAATGPASALLGPSGADPGTTHTTGQTPRIAG